MKYQVMYNNGTRIRVRSGQAAFTKKEGYGISSLLLENNFIKKVFTSHRNGSILIYYDDVKNRDKVFAALDKITEDDLVEVEPDMSQIGPMFKKDAGKIIGYLKSRDIEEIADELENSGELAIGCLLYTSDAADD